MHVSGPDFHIGLEQLRRAPHDPRGDDVKGVGIHHNAHGAGAGHEELCPQSHAGVGTAAALGADQIVKMHSAVGNLLDAGHIAQSAQGIGAAAGDFIIGPAQFLAHTVHFGINVVIAVGVHKAYIGVHQVFQELIALALGDTPLFQNEDRRHAQLFGAGGGQHGVVGLGAAGGKHHLSPLGFGLSQQKLQFANLIAPQTDTGHIIPLDPHIGAQNPADVLQLLNGRGQYGERNSRKIIQTFHGSLLFERIDGIIHYLVGKHKSEGGRSGA